MLTLNCYLNDVAAGGATRFYQDAKTRPQLPVEVLSVAPVAGRAVLFRQPPEANILHDGEKLLAGVKYLLRTDVMYRRRRAERAAAGEECVKEN